nr:DEAD/DEAH box helicase [Angustibacter aerolatus]
MTAGPVHPHRLEVPSSADPDAVYDAFTTWTTHRGLTLYPAQDEGVVEVVSGSNLVLATPTGSGKSLVAVAAHLSALAAGRRTYYTAPIKALVSEKFFEPGAHVRGRARRHGHRRRLGERRRADHRLHRRDPGERRAARGPRRRRRPGGDGRVPLLRRPPARLGLAGAARRAAADAVRADVGDARRHHRPARRPHPPHRPADRPGGRGRAAGAAVVPLLDGPAARGAAGACSTPTRRRSTWCTRRRRRRPSERRR